jgi:hypothetical protein
MNPTDLRLKLIRRPLELCQLELFDGILLTGSMVFGRYHSVHETSDIDYIFIINPDKTPQLLEDAFFKATNINHDLIKAFADRHIDRFWLDYESDGIKFNIGIWQRAFVNDFVALRAPVHRLGTRNGLVRPIEVSDVWGSDYIYTPDVESYGDIFVKSFLLKHNGVLLESPSYCNLVACEVLYDPDGVWRGLDQRLIDGLNQYCGIAWYDGFMDYILRKAAPEYKRQLEIRVGL